MIPIPGTSKDTGKKRKLKAGGEAVQDPVKRPRLNPKKETKVKTKSPAKVQAQVEPKSPKVKHSKTTKGKGKGTAPADDEDDEDNSDLENHYLHGKSTQAETLNHDKSGSEEDLSELVHESVKSRGKKSSGLKQKFIPSTETPEQRDRRTIFVGNLPIGIAQKKVHYRGLCLLNPN